MLASVRNVEWARPAVLGLVGAAVYGWGASGGAPHFYYGAAVRSMSTSWSGLLFGALDPAGSITLDKSPGAFWLQAILVRALGFHDWVLLLPGVVAAAACVPLLYATVRRWAGERAGLIAAIVLALTPATFAAARVNLPDTIMVLCLVGAAYALTRALEPDAALRWIVLAGALLGAGFLAKMLQAWTVLPAFCAACLVAPDRGRRSAAKVAALVTTTVVVSLSWATVVSLVPAGRRPYVDGSSGDSAWEMLFAYNGAIRTLGGSGLTAMSVPFGGAPGPARLLDVQLAGQIGWLLPAALLLGTIAAVLTWHRQPELRSGWVLWGGWFLATAVAFSALRGIHPYYAATLAPALAALVGAGADRCPRWALVTATALTAIIGLVVIGRTPPAAAPLAATVLVVAAATALVARGRTFTVAAAVAALIGPATWIAVTPPLSANAFGTTNPVAGPQAPEVVYGATVTTPLLSMITGAKPGTPTPPTDAAMAGSRPQPELVGFLLRHREPGQRYLFATGNAGTAAPYIAAGHSVLPMGGFTSAAPYPSAPMLEDLVRERAVRFVLDIPTPGAAGAAGARAAWLDAHCAPVDPSAYGNALPYAVLHDCGPAATPPPPPPG